jgi:Mg-chelatase subunit ChlD
MMGTASVHGTHGLRRLALALGAIVVLCLALAAKAPAAYVGATDAAAPASIANGASTGYTLDFEGTTVSRTTPTDVVLVFDESSSISAADFSKERAFATDIVNSLDVFLDGGTVGVVQFSTDARQTLAPTSIRQSAINRIAVMSQRGGNTCIGCGIQAAQQMFQPLGSGRRRVQIVLTDGLDNVNTNTLASIVTAAKGDGE